MGSEVFKLKSLPVDDTVVRGSRIGQKNATNTQTVLVNPYGEEGIKTGEKNVIKDYLIQASLVGNELKGYASFSEGNDVISGYTGPQDLNHGDIIRSDGDTRFYTVTGIQGENVYITTEYEGVSKDGVCTLRKVDLDSVTYEQVSSSFSEGLMSYDKEELDWGVTGLQGFTGPITASSNTTTLDRGLDIQFLKGTSSSLPDIVAVDSVYKTVVNDNPEPIVDQPLSPIPYPHESLQIFAGRVGEDVKKLKEFDPSKFDPRDPTTFEGDYVINYTQEPDFLYPYPPFEERQVAFIKFLDSLIDETQVGAIGGSFNGAITINKLVDIPDGSQALVSVQEIIPDSDDIKIASESLVRNEQYIINTDAGIATFVSHENSEQLIESISYVKRLMWDGVSVIRGVGAQGLKGKKNSESNQDLVIPGVTGLEGVTGIMYFEDTDENNLLRDSEYIIEFGSGAVRINNPMKEDEAVLVSYYVEGVDEEKEQIFPDSLRTKKFPVIPDTMSIVKRENTTDPDARVVVLVEGEDYEVSYLTGNIKIFNTELLDPTQYTLEVNYIPLAQINCILQENPTEDFTYNMRIVDDILETVGSPENLIFKVNNTSVSVPHEDYFKKPTDPTRYSFDGTLEEGSIQSIRNGFKPEESYNVTGFSYDDFKREISLDTSINEKVPEEGDRVLGTYNFINDVLPYAPVVVLYPTIEEGSNVIVIEGFDRTESIKKDMIIRIDNLDPKRTYYYRIQDVQYINSNTEITVYGTFPETVNVPTFYLFDDRIVWNALPEGVFIDRTSSPGSSAFQLKGNVLEVQESIKNDKILTINNTDIYTVISTSVEEDITTVNIFPPLFSSITGSITVSTLPVYEPGATSLSAKNRILTDPVQPAFRLSYVAPDGFDGNATVFIDEENIILREFIRGIQNPESYVFKKADYTDILEMAKDIQATPSTFNKNVPFVPGLPDYNPFTIFPEGKTKDDYYLGDGTWSPDLVIPFEGEDELNLPYVFTIIPELLKRSLLEIFKNQEGFTVADTDKTGLFKDTNLVAFWDTYNNKTYYHEVSGSELVDDEVDESVKNTDVSTYDAIRENVINPATFKYDNAVWANFENVLSSVDYDNSTITFEGSIRSNIRVGTLLKIDRNHIYYVKGVTEDTDTFTLRLDPEIDENVVVNNDEGYVQQTVSPVPLNDVSPQPSLALLYTAPEGHTGEAAVTVNASNIVLSETVDNFNGPALLTFEYEDYDSIISLFDAVKETPSAIQGVDEYFPFYYYINPVHKALIENDNFEQYKPQPTVQETALSYTLPITVSSFDITYTIPSGYEGTGSVLITPTHIFLKEELKNISTEEEFDKETSILYLDTASIFDFAENVLPGVESVVSGVFPFSTNLNDMGNFVSSGSWNSTFIPFDDRGFVEHPDRMLVYVTIGVDSWIALGSLNEKRLTPDDDYTIDSGLITLVKPLEKLNRFRFNYMGLNTLADKSDETITCTCKFFSALARKSRLDVYMDFLNIDQFYIQKLTEQKFLEIVTVPQIEEILGQSGGGGQSADTSAGDESTPVYEGGLANLYYQLKDEEIKKQLYLRIYKWYKERLRAFSAELQLGLGFKFANSRSAAQIGNTYTMLDAYVESQSDYTLTTVENIEEIQNGFSRFFPLGYNETAPKYYNRFDTRYTSFNDVCCCNITYLKDGENLTIGIIKSSSPYWSREADLTYDVWEDAYINKNLVARYSVDVPDADKQFGSDTYTFLKIIDVDDEINITRSKKKYKVAEIAAPEGSSFEYITLDKPFSNKGIRAFNLVDVNADRKATKDPDTGQPYLDPDTGQPYPELSLVEFIGTLPDYGYNISVKRSQIETFPMYNDGFSLGALVDGDVIEGHKTNTKKISKPFGGLFLALLFPWLAALESPKNFKIRVKRDSEQSPEWEDLVEVDLSKLNFLEERKIDDTLDALRYGFDDDDDIKEQKGEGLGQYFYLSFERLYDEDSDDGYVEAIILRPKNRAWWYQVVDGSGEPVVNDYGFVPNTEYRNFYEPENIYKKMLKEKQGWETEYLILRDLFDFSDKIGRAYKQAFINQQVSDYRGYMSKPDGSTVNGISDVLKARITAYSPELGYLIAPQGPPQKIITPDFVHQEDDASEAIALSYQQTVSAKTDYTNFYNKMVFYNALNDRNNVDWRKKYIPWVLSIQKGNVFQTQAREMFDSNSRNLTFGLYELPAIHINFKANSEFEIESGVIAVSNNYFVKSDTEARIISIVVTLVSKEDPEQRFENIGFSVVCYDVSEVSGKEVVTHKPIDQIVSLVNEIEFQGTSIFESSNVFQYQENNITKDLLQGNWDFDIVNGNNFDVTSVEDHRKADPRVLFLSRNVEDRLYTEELRDLQALSVEYVGKFYEVLESSLSFKIVAQDKTSLRERTYVSSLSTVSNINENGLVEISVQYGYKIPDRGLVGTVSNINITGFTLFDSSLNRYKTIAELKIEVESYKPDDWPLDTFFTFIEEGDTSRSTESTVFIDEWSSGIEKDDDIILSYYFRITTDFEQISDNIDNTQYRVYRDDDFRKKIEFSFPEIDVDGSFVTKDDRIKVETITYEFQKEDNSYKTLSEIASEITADRYKNNQLFEATSVFDGEQGSDLSTRFIVAENRIIPFGADKTALVNADVELDTTGIQNAYFSYPVYTSNGNEAKSPIDGLFVAGQWEVTPPVQVFSVEVTDNAEWVIDFTDVDAGNIKSYMADGDIIEAIDTTGIITREQYEVLSQIEDVPQITVLKNIVFTRKGVEKDRILEVNLRQYDTINEVVSVINEARFDDVGNLDPAGNNKIFNATLVGTEEDEGTYRSFEIHANYVPVLRSFRILNEDGNSEFKVGHIVGWEIETIEIDAGKSHTFNITDRRYSPGDTYNFRVDSPDTAYNNTLNNFPEGFRQDILAFNVYCWDEANAGGVRNYEILDNNIYFTSANVNRVGIPLAGSGDPLAPDNETMRELTERINNNLQINSFFYVNLKFTRDVESDPGFFEYSYLPDQVHMLPKSELQDFFLREDTGMQLTDNDTSSSPEYKIIPTGDIIFPDIATSATLHTKADVHILNMGKSSDYLFTTSSYTLDDTLDTLDMSADWKFPIDFSVTYDFGNPLYDTIGELVTAIDAETVPELGNLLFNATLLSADDSIELLSTSGEVSLPEGVEVTFKKTANIDAVKIKLNTAAAGYEVSSFSVKIPTNRTSMTISGVITYTGSYTVPTYDISVGNFTAQTLSDSISALKPPEAGANSLLTEIFNVPVVNSLYVSTDASTFIDSTGFVGGISNIEVTVENMYTLSAVTLSDVVTAVNLNTTATGITATLIDVYSGIPANLLIPEASYLPIINPINLEVDLRRVTGMRLLNMNVEATFQINSNDTVFGHSEDLMKNFTSNLPEDKDIHALIEEIRGNITSGMLEVDMLPIKVSSIQYGQFSYTDAIDLPANEPTPGYFGIMGDVQFLQISDYDLYQQMNRVKERLGMPWKNDEGIVVPDYYTEESFNVNNPYAIDLENFLGWLRGTRYSQIKDSVVNEAIVTNKYFWLYMKLHREFGCDQRVIALTKQIEQQKNDQNTLNGLS